MFNCPVCLHKSESAHSCERCGFVKTINVADAASKAALDAEDIADHEKELLEGIHLTIIANSYKGCDDHFEFDEKVEVKFMDGPDLKMGQIVWNEHPFAQGKHMKNSSMCVKLQGPDFDRTLNLTFDSTGLTGFWRVGIEIEAGYYARCVIGSKLDKRYTESFSLLRM